jgi:hypothetical protein
MNQSTIETPLKPIGKGIKRSLNNHPFYFGHYLNMAMHNAYKIVVHLSEKHNLKTDKLDESKIATSELINVLSKGNPVIISAITRDLKRHFPFLYYMEQKGSDNKPIELNASDIQRNLKEAFTLLNALRNNYAHYDNVKPIKPSSETKYKPFLMFEVYKSAYHKLSTRYNHEERGFKEKDIEDLHPETGKHLPPELTTALATDAYYAKSLAFFTCLFLEPAHASVFLSRLYGFHNTTTPQYRATRACYMMYCSRLPERKLESSDIVLDMLNELGRYPKSLFDVWSEEDKSRETQIEKINEDDNEEERYNQTKRHNDRFPYFALRYFDDAKVNGTRFLGNMYFQIQLGKYLKKPSYIKKMYGEDQDRYLISPVYTFGNLSHFRNQYEAVNQDNIHEKIVLKKEVFKIHAKQWLNADETKLREEIIQFSPQYNFGENNIGFKIYDSQRQNLLPPFISKKGTSKTGEEITVIKAKQDAPTAIMSTYELQNLFLYQHLHHAGFIEHDAPTFINDFVKKIQQLFADIKSGELVPNQNYTFLKYQKHLIEPKKWKTDKYEEFQVKIKEFAVKEAKNKALIERRRKELSREIETRYGIKRNALPDSIMEYLLGYKPAQYIDLAKEKLENQKEDVENRLKKMGEAKKNKHKFKKQKDEKEKVKKYPNLGEMASYIAEDIVYLMPHKIHIANGKPHDQKINSDQFRNLQYALAMFGSEKENIKKYFVELKLMQKESDVIHPFLNIISIDKCHGIVDFYIAYLKEKEKFIENVKDFVKINTETAVKDKYGYILSIDVKKATDKDFTQFPIFLPRGLFREAIIKALQVHKPELNIQGRDNIVRCLSRFLDNQKQPFYNNPRYIKPYDRETNTEGVPVEFNTRLAELNIEIKEIEQRLEEATMFRHNEAKLNGKNSEEATDAKEEEQHIKYQLNDYQKEVDKIRDFDKVVRYTESNDRALWLMILDLLKSQHPELKDLEEKKLEDIESILDSPVKAREKIYDVYVTDDSLKIKNYGKLRSILKDRRLQGLVSYFEKEEEIPFDILKAELDCYDKRRETFSDLIYEFEKAVAEHDVLKTKFPILDSDNPRYNHKIFMANYGVIKNNEDNRDYFDHEIFVAVASELVDDATLQTKYRTEILKLRNKIFHNEFPCKYQDEENGPFILTWLKAEIDSRDNEDLITNRIFDIAEEYYSALLDKIKG